MMKMKIAITGTLGLPVTYGGVERQVEQICSRLVDRGHEVTVYCRSYYSRLADDCYEGIKLVRLPSIKTKHLDNFSHTFISTIDSLLNGFDIVHYHSLGPAVFSCLPRIRHKKTVVTIHGLDWQRKKWGRLASEYLKASERFALYFPNGTIGVSKQIQRYIRQKYRREI